MSSIDPKDIEIRVSSVLNKDVKQYGKQYLFDGRDDTCWNSDQGNNWIECRFKREIRLKEVMIQFQGGFAAKQIVLQFLSPENQLIDENYLYANDKNDLQVFKQLSQMSTNKIKIVFNECSDLFGRIIVYKLDLLVENI